MAGEAAAVRQTTYGDYLALERETDQRHEWFDGRAFAMAGGTPAHSALGAAMAAELRGLAQKCGCQVFNSDGKVRVTETGLATYPDASVVCGRLELDAEDRHAITNPALLVEVLSEGTERYDRGEKFSHFRTIASLRDYVLVAQHTKRIELYSREGDHWVYRVAGPGGSLTLTALDGALSVDRVYAGISLEGAG